MKRKKLYHPKKCYVRIQIPRKGYFYRSTFGLQNTESSSSNLGKRRVVPNSKISDLAPSRSKAASLPNKEILKKQTEAELLDVQPFETFTPEYVEELLCELNDQAFTDEFNQRVNEYVALNWPQDGQESSFQDILVDFENILNGGETQRSAISENLNNDSTKNHSESTWNSFINCINTALGPEKFIYNLEVTQMNGSPIKNSILQIIQEEPMPENVIQGQETGETLGPATFSSPHTEYSTPSLMSGVDLHLEFQNYMKTIETSHASRTKNTLQCNFHDNYIPLQIYCSSQELQNRVEEFFDAIENKSGSSFDSATSNCQELEEVTNKMFHDVIPNTNEFLVDERRIAIALGQFQEKDSKLTKRKDVKTSLSVLKLNDKTTWDSMFLYGKKYSRRDAGDDYEKIKPIGVTSTGRKSGSRLLLLNLIPNTGKNVPSEHPLTDLTEQKTPTWSPTLQELIEIYSSVLRQNKKIQGSSSSITRHFSSHIISFLNEKVKEKQYKYYLMNLSKDLTMNLNPENGSKSTNNLVTIEEYVAIFQEILQSSLSINQIARINNIISGLQDYPDKNYNYLKELDDEIKNLSKGCTLEQIIQELRKPKVKLKKEKTAYKPPSKAKISTKSKTSLTLKTSEKQTKPTIPRSVQLQMKSKISQRIPEPRTTLKSGQKLNKTEPTELNSILKLCCMDGGLLKKPKKIKNKKVLVSVKLLGNQVLVNSFSFLNNENTLSDKKQELNGTSELIIENVTNTQINGIWWKNNKSNRLRLENLDKNQNKNSKKATKVKRKNGKPKIEEQQKAKEFLETVEQPTECQTQFVYDQAQFRAQHPIEVIAETSESKASQTAGNSEEEQWKDPPLETKILLQDIPPNPKAMEKVLKAALDRKVFSKNLTCGLERSEVEIGRNRFPINWKPALKFRSQTKQQPTPKKHAVMVSSMVDLKKRSKVRKTQTYRPQSIYLCYSSLQNNIAKGNKKAQGGSIQWKLNTLFKQKPPEKRKVSRESSKETCPKHKNMEYRQTSDSGTHSTDERSPERFSLLPSVKSSSDTHSSKENCALEFLFPENEKHSLEEYPASVNSVASIQKKSSICGTNSKKKESSIALLSPTNCNDCISFLAEMIHSDSFLDNFPQPISQGKLNTILGTDTDLKFYPGRLTESGNSEKPLVTFVLTPSQQNLAGLPEHQVTVVKKGQAGTSDENDMENPEILGSEKSDGKDEISLKSIEEFIAYLSNFRKAVNHTTPNTTERDKPEQVTAKCSKKKSNPVPETSAQITRKPLHECQKRKLTEINKKKPVKEETIANNLKKKKKQELLTSVADLQKLVDSLTRLVDNIKEKNTSASEKNDNWKTDSESVDAERSEREEVPPEIIEMVKTALSMAKSSARRKQKPQIGISTKSKTVKLEIHCSGQKQKKRQKECKESGKPHQGEVKPNTAEKIDLLDSLLSESGDLKKSSSTYFDAVDLTGGDYEQMPANSNCISQTTAEGNHKSEVKEVKHVIFTPSDKQLFSKDIIGRESEDKIFQKISKSLKEGEISYSMALLESFMSKSENSNSKLIKLVSLIESKTKDEMLKMERVTWMKVQLLFQEAIQLMEHNNKKPQYNSKQFPEILNLSQQDNRNIMNRIKQSFRRLKEKFSLSQISSQNLNDLDLTGCEAVIKISSANTDLEIPEVGTNQGNERDVEELKRKLRQQYKSLQQLIEEDSTECVPQEIRNMRKTVAEKIKEVEKALEVHDEWETSSRVANYCSRATSLLQLAMSYRKPGSGGSGSSCSRKDTSAGLKLDSRPGYVDVIRGLMKVWDTRLAISCITGECFR